MTAPAVVRRWAGAPSSGVGRDAPGSRPPAALVGLGSLIRERLAAARRVAPLGAVLVTALLAHAAVAPHLAVRRVAPDVLAVAMVAVAVGRGRRAGAAFGFAAGLGTDLFLATPLGTAALAYTVVGHVLGEARRPPASATAAALCRPDAPCFACRSGRRHRSAGTGQAHTGSRPPRLRRRAATRRAGLQRPLVLTFAAVAAVRSGTAVVATALAGAPFPPAAGLTRIAAAAAVSAPLGPPVFAALRRLPTGAPGGGGR